METKEIVAKMLENFKTDKGDFIELENAVRVTVDKIVKRNCLVFKEISGEKQFFEVIEGISEGLISNDELEKDIKLSPALELVDGIIIDTQRKPMTLLALAWIDTYGIDKIFGSDWFVFLKNLATGYALELN